MSQALSRDTATRTTGRRIQGTMAVRIRTIRLPGRPRSSPPSQSDQRRSRPCSGRFNADHDHAAVDHGGEHDTRLGHGGRGDHHGDHAAQFRNRFWLSLVLTIQVVIFSEMFAGLPRSRSCRRVDTVSRW